MATTSHLSVRVRNPEPHDRTARVAVPDHPAPGTFDRHLGLALLLVALVVIPRALTIAWAHSETYDEAFHLRRGIAFLTGTLAAKDYRLNDPPLGGGLAALPILVTNLLEGREASDDRLYDRPGRAETISARIALWNALLFLPLAGVVFAWCRRVYGLRSAWLATAMIAVEPNLAAHQPLATVDVMSVTAIVAAGFLGWRYFERPTTGGMVALGTAVALALMLKHTAALVPIILGAMALLWWGLRPWLDRQDASDWRAALPARLVAPLQLGLVALVALWVFTLFDVSPPISPIDSEHALNPSALNQGGAHGMRLRLERALHLTSPWPAGCYLRAFRTGLAHGMGGHDAYLFGQRRPIGWWYYFPVVATYKVPLGIAGVLLLGALSLRRSPPRWDEWGFFVPMVAYALFLMNNKVNIGFRHFLPAYIFALPLGSRCLAAGGRAWIIAAWTAVAAAGLHAASYHPDYLAYMNAPRHKPYLTISDSNVDWGQGLKQARDWIDAHPHAGRRVSLRFFGTNFHDSEGVRYYMGDRAVLLGDDDPPPTTGLLIISPVWEAIPQTPSSDYRALQPFKPDAVIGHCLLVYDLDRLGDGKPFRWSLP